MRGPAIALPSLVSRPSVPRSEVLEALRSLGILTPEYLRAVRISPDEIVLEVTFIDGGVTADSYQRIRLTDPEPQDSGSDHA